MEMLLWAVGSFHVFGEQLDPTCVLAVRFKCLFRQTQISGLLARCKVPSWALWQKADIFPRKAFIFPRKAFIFLRMAFIFLRRAPIFLRSAR